MIAVGMQTYCPFPLPGALKPGSERLSYSLRIFAPGIMVGIVTITPEPEHQTP